MHRRPDREPPLRALAAFDAAMRHHSFTLAAADLAVTPGAIGQQVQKLEDWLGTLLFVRGTRHIEPTTDALAYWSVIQPALARLRVASHALRRRQTKEVHLSMPPSFAAKWFAPRMAGFLASHADVQLHLSASTEVVDFAQQTCDLAVRYGTGDDPELDTTPLGDDCAIVYCSPAYARRLALRHPSDLAAATLLHTTLHPHWTTWLRRHAGFSEERSAALPGLHFDQSLLAIEAALADQGVVICSPWLSEKEVRDGTLITPFDPASHALPLSKTYHLVHPRQARLSPAAKDFKAWLLAAAGVAAA